MPNEVYEMTHAALSALVSQRAATRVLNVALEASNADADTITVRAMRRLLAGRVRRELSVTLPTAGLTRSLKQIADDLYRLQPSPTTQVQLPSQEERDAIERQLVGAGAAPTWPAPGRAGSTRPAAVAGSAVMTHEPAADFSALAAPNRTAPRMPVLAGPARLDVGPELNEQLMTAALRSFGELETVEQVVIVRASEVLLERGAGVRTDRLPNLVRSTKHLLSRAGRLRLYALERQQGILFVFPVGDGAIVVITKPNVNIGAVLAARAALEEAA